LIIFRPEQAWALSLATLEDIGESLVEDEKRDYYVTKFKSLRRLTPGDFDTVRRQLRFTNAEMSVESLLEGLRQVLIEKAGAQKPRVGFKANAAMI
jgi:hypothetical protein